MCVEERGERRCVEERGGVLGAKVNGVVLLRQIPSRLKEALRSSKELLERRLQEEQRQVRARTYMVEEVASSVLFMFSTEFSRAP